MSDAAQKTTPLYEEHVRLGAKMVPFGDWLMPVQYSGIMDEHQAVRNNVGVFDISHMGQLVATGPGTGRWLNEMLTNNIDKLERRFGFLAIHGLIRAVVTLSGLVFVLVLLNQGFDSYLALDIARIRAGEVWRLVTYIFVPQTTHFLLVVFALWFLWIIGDRLEQAWGAFRLTLYFLVGMIGTTVAALLTNSQFSNQMLFTTLFFAFAHLFPEEVFYVFLILPLKVKWMAWIYAGFLLLAFVTQSNSFRLALIAALSNYLIFFGPGVIQQLRQRKEVAVRRQRFEVQSRSEAEPLHKCATCGATELTDPSLEFRVARDGEEYCLAHLPRPANAPV